MNRAVKILKIFAAMSDHRSREGSHCFGGNLNRAGSEKLVVRSHEENVRTPNPPSQATAWQACPELPLRAAAATTQSRLMKLIAPLRSTRPFFTLETSSSWKL